jgi:hypothetical protein
MWGTKDTPRRRLGRVHMRPPGPAVRSILQWFHIVDRGPSLVSKGFLQVRPGVVLLSPPGLLIGGRGWSESRGMQTNNDVVIEKQWLGKGSRNKNRRAETREDETYLHMRSIRRACNGKYRFLQIETTSRVHASKQENETEQHASIYDTYEDELAHVSQQIAYLISPLCFSVIVSLYMYVWLGSLSLSLSLSFSRLLLYLACHGRHARLGRLLALRYFFSVCLPACRFYLSVALLLSQISPRLSLHLPCRNLSHSAISFSFAFLSQCGPPVLSASISPFNLSRAPSWMCNKHWQTKHVAPKKSFWCCARSCP